MTPIPCSAPATMPAARTITAAQAARTLDFLHEYIEARAGALEPPTRAGLASVLGALARGAAALRYVNSVEEDKPLDWATASRL